MKCSQCRSTNPQLNELHVDVYSSNLQSAIHQAMGSLVLEQSGGPAENWHVSKLGAEKARIEEENGNGGLVFALAYDDSPKTAHQTQVARSRESLWSRNIIRTPLDSS
ncbi:hypothetical protein VNO78_08452 [Psophocarpus tetragonolobus]|uniref:Uncharacterized protein n=1 Tax=Psophocarpus tetragonolobus TaxID=3891 RepID=A0AAN9SUU7_PSOTE